MRRAVCLLLAGFALATPATAAPLNMTATPVLLDYENHSVRDIGKLHYLAGFELQAGDSAFGGWSGMLIDPAGARLRAVSDAGALMTLTLTHDANDVLSGFAAADMIRLRDTSGQTLSGKRGADAESMALHGAGDVLIGFEQNHRIWRYAGLDGPAAGFSAPPGIGKAAANRGLEALARLSDGRFLAIAEGLGSRTWTQGWIGDSQGNWQTFRYLREDDFRPTGAAPLPDGGALILERRFSRLTGIFTRLRRLGAADIRAGDTFNGELLATLSAPMTIDNFEAIATRTGSDGSTLVYLLSDDNFNFFQQTLLFQFRLLD